MQTIRLFDTAQAARDYRHQHGTGGWIFQPEAAPGSPCAETQSILFPPELTPSAIFHHPLTRGRTGRLIGN